MEPVYTTDLGKLYNGDALSVLKELESESVSMCITSPPYWALRDYGTDGQIWDGDVDCEHEWGTSIKQDKNWRGGTTNPEVSPKMAIKGKTNFAEVPISYSNFCIHCGAWKGQLGLEPDFNLYIKHLCDIFDEVKRVLRKDGTCWVNLGDTYASSRGAGTSDNGTGSGIVSRRYADSFDFGRSGKNCSESMKRANNRRGRGRCPDGMEMKSLLNIPARFSIAMQDRGWILRNKIIWHKPNCMPSSVTDRFTVDFEEIFFFAKSKKYYFEQQFEPLDIESKKRAMRGNKDNKYASGEYLPNGQHAHTMSKPREYKGYDDMDDAIERGETSLNPQGRNKRTVWTAETKYEDLLQEKKMRQGMNKERGNNLIEKRDLPQQKEFVDYMRKNYTVEQIVEKTGMQRTKVEHWFRYDESGFSYPSKEDWEVLGDEAFPELIEVWYEADEVKSSDNGRNKRTVWRISTKGYSGAHFAVFPKELIETPIKAGCPKAICTKCNKPREKIYEYTGNDIPKGGGKCLKYKDSGLNLSPTSTLLTKTLKEKADKGYTTCDCNAPFKPGIVLDPFMGSGTTAQYCEENHLGWIGIEISEKYCGLIKERIDPFKKQARITSFVGE